MPDKQNAPVRNVCRFPEHSNGTVVLSQQVALFCELDLGLVGLENTSLSVERSEKDKDADEDADADRVRTGQPVGGHWSLSSRR